MMGRARGSGGCTRQPGWPSRGIITMCAVERREIAFDAEYSGACTRAEEI